MAVQGWITWLGHSAMKLELPDERVVYIDPWLRENPSCPAGEKEPGRCDLIALTHGHSDHVGDTIELAARFSPRIVGNYDLCEVLAPACGKAEMRPMNIGGTQTVDGVEWTMTRAYHSSAVHVGGATHYAGMPAGLVIRVPGLAVLYHAGDTDVFGDMSLIARLHRPAVAALPIGDLFTMGPRGAALAVELLDPTQVLPIHYGTIDMLTGTVQALRDALPDGLRGRVLSVSPGQRLAWTLEGVQTAIDA